MADKFTLAKYKYAPGLCTRDSLRASVSHQTLLTRQRDQDELKVRQWGKESAYLGYEAVRQSGRADRGVIRATNTSI